MILKGRIKTTYAKAKAITSLIEKLVTKAKDGSRSSINQIYSFLNKKEPVRILLNDIAPRFKEKIGGYVRMVRQGQRAGDNAQEVLMEWTVKESAPVKNQSSTGQKEVKMLEKKASVEGRSKISKKAKK